MTFATLFSGGEGAGCGMRAAGMEHTWGVELEPTIAEVAAANGFSLRVGNILNMTPRSFEPVDALHASPPCPNFSRAKTGGKESALDLALAEKTAEFVTTLEPRLFTLENVWQYRDSKSFALICNALSKAGYFFDIQHINAASFGVPQTRQRLILRAVHGGFVPALPEPVRWVGWYEAIEDLIPMLPESAFAPWQLERLGKRELSETTLVGDQERQFRTWDAPAVTVRAGASGGAEPRAFLVESKNANQEYGKGYREKDTPAYTVVTDGNSSHLPKAFLMSNAKTEFGDGVRAAPEPAFTATSQMVGRSRAFLMSNDNAAQEFGKGYRAADEPTVMLTASKQMRAWLEQGRVVAMTPRALARFQSFPDTYILPKKKTLACKVIGNSCPPLLMQRIYEGMTA